MFIYNKTLVESKLSFRKLVLYLKDYLVYYKEVIAPKQ